MTCTNRHLDERPEVAGSCFGVRLITEPDGHPRVQICVEDDGNWFTHGNSFDVYWIEDIISVLKVAKNIAKKQKKQKEKKVRS